MAERWTDSDTQSGSEITRVSDHGEQDTPVMAFIPYNYSESDDEHTARVRLIAAAPELLEALYACDVVMDTAGILGISQQLPPAYKDSWAAAHIKAREVLAKAKGEQE